MRSSDGPVSAAGARRGALPAQDEGAQAGVFIIIIIIIIIMIIIMINYYYYDDDDDDDLILSW